MLRAGVRCRIARFPDLEQIVSSYTVRSRFDSRRSVANDRLRVESRMDKAADATEQTPHAETIDSASEGAPETFEVFQPPDVKSNTEGGKCNPLTDPHCAHDDKLPAVTGPKGYSTEDS